MLLRLLMQGRRVTCSRPAENMHSLPNAVYVVLRLMDGHRAAQQARCGGVRLVTDSLIKSDFSRVRFRADSKLERSRVLSRRLRVNGRVLRCRS